MTPLDQLVALAKNPTAVDQHPFRPFILYYKRWRSFQSLSKQSKIKERPIRYACREDSVIYSYYRHLLSARYEAILVDLGIQDCPIAYRKIPSTCGTRGQCNIDFAATAFAHVRALKSCCAVTMDISGFFDNIDHTGLRAAWNRILGTKHFSRDHEAVFKAITGYSDVLRDSLYERLEIIGDKRRSDGQIIKGYLIPRHKIKARLCTAKQFREKVCGEDGKYTKLFTRNKLSYGIPQGAPISDILANIFLIDFDVAIQAYVRALDGVYFRYSDDIFVLIPGGEQEGRAAEAHVSQEIQKYGKNLKIKPEKTAIVTFAPDLNGQLTARRIDKPANRDGLEYLGFRFDGKNVYVRNGTISKFYRGIAFAARRRARSIVKRYMGKDMEFLLKEFNLQEFEQRFGKVVEFESGAEPRSWTFRTYIKRCAKVFGSNGRYFFRQTRNYQKIIRRLALLELDRARRAATGGRSAAVNLS